MSRRLSLNAGEISALLQAAEYVDPDTAFNLTTEGGTKMLARYDAAIAKLRAKLGRIQKSSRGEL
jgi:hypothetical protein